MCRSMNIQVMEYPAYYRRLNDYFPEQELKHPGQLEDLVEEQPLYHKLETSDYLILYAEFPDFLFVDYLLVNQKKRGQGIGSKVMARLKSLKKPIVLEVEPADPTVPDTILRRKFYRRHGFQEAESVMYQRRDEANQSFEMDILYFAPNETLDDAQVLEMMASVCKHVHNYRAGDYYDRIPADPNTVLWLDDMSDDDVEASI